MAFAPETDVAMERGGAFGSYAFRVQLCFFGSVCEYWTEDAHAVKRLWFIFRSFLVKKPQTPDLAFWLIAREGTTFLREIVSPSRKFSIRYRHGVEQNIHEWQFPDTPFPPLRVPPLRARFLVLHGCALVTPSGKTVVIPAPSLTGKTTLLVECIRRGFKAIADDVLFIDRHTLRIYRYPKPVSIRSNCLGLVPEVADAIKQRRPPSLVFLESEPASKTWFLHLDDLYHGCFTREESHSVDFVVLLDRTKPSGKLVRIPRSQALLHSLTNTCCSGISKTETISLCARLVNTAATYLLPLCQVRSAGDELERLA